MNLEEALNEAAICEQQIALRQALLNLLVPFRSIEGMPPDNIIWLDTGGKVQDSVVEGYNTQLIKEIEQWTTKRTNLLKKKLRK